METFPLLLSGRDQLIGQNMLIPTKRGETRVGQEATAHGRVDLLAASDDLQRVANDVGRNVEAGDARRLADTENESRQRHARVPLALGVDQKWLSRTRQVSREQPVLEQPGDRR